MKAGRCLAVFVAIFMLVAAIPFSVAAGSPPLEVFVDPAHDDSTPGWNVTHFALIQDGIDAVAPEDGTVYVNPGTYEENLTIDKSLSLMGGPGVVLDGTLLGGRGIFISNTGSFDVTIEGFEIRNFATNGIRTQIGGDHGTLTIRDCKIHNNSRNGISIQDTSFNTLVLDTVEVHNNDLLGMRIFDGSVIIELDIVDSNFYENGMQGVSIEGVDTDIGLFTVEGSTFNNNAGAGLRLAGDFIEEFEAVGSSFDNNNNGLVIDMISGIKNFILIECSASGNSTRGLRVLGAGAIEQMRFENSYFDNNTGWGIILRDVDDFDFFTMSGGSISGNAGGMLARGDLNLNLMAFLGVTVADNHDGPGIALASGTYGPVLFYGVEFFNNSDEHIVAGVDGMDGDVTLNYLIVYYSSFDWVDDISVYLDGTTTVNESAGAQMCWWGSPDYPDDRFSEGIEVTSWALDEDFTAFGTYYEIEDATDPFEIWDLNLAFVDLEELDEADELVFISGWGDYDLIFPVGIIPDGITTAAIVQRDVNHWLDNFPDWLEGDDAADAPSGFMFQSKIFRFKMLDFSGGLEPTEDDLVTQFDGNFTLIFYFDPDGIDNPELLDVYWFDGTEWIALGGLVDMVAGSVTVEVDHWSDFALMEQQVYTVTFEETTGLEPTIEISEEGSDIWTELAAANVDLKNGNYLFRATLEGYEDYEGTFEVASEDKTVEFTMEAVEEPVVEDPVVEDPAPETPVTGTGIMWLVPMGWLILAAGMFISRKALA